MWHTAVVLPYLIRIDGRETSGNSNTGTLKEGRLVKKTLLLFTFVFGVSYAAFAEGKSRSRRGCRSDHRCPIALTANAVSRGHHSLRLVVCKLLILCGLDPRNPEPKSHHGYTEGYRSILTRSKFKDRLPDRYGGKRTHKLQ